MDSGEAEASCSSCGGASLGRMMTSPVEPAEDERGRCTALSTRHERCTALSTRHERCTALPAGRGAARGTRLPSCTPPAASAAPGRRHRTLSLAWRCYFGRRARGMRSRPGGSHLPGQGVQPRWVFCRNKNIRIQLHGNSHWQLSNEMYIYRTRRVCKINDHSHTMRIFIKRIF